MAERRPSDEPARLIYRPGDDVEDLVAEWVNRPALRSLVKAFGGAWPGTTAPRALLDRLAKFSEIWDLRAGASRLELPVVDAEVPPFSAVPAAADALGLVRQPPPSGDASDYVVVLGGLATGTTSRIEYLESLVKAGVVRPARGIVLLGSFRPLAAKEREFLRNRYLTLPGAATEVDLLERHLDVVFPTGTSWVSEFDGDVEIDPHRACLHAQRVGTPTQHVLAAASSDPGQRPANTADTLEFAAARLSFVAGDRLQLVTSAIYAVYQLFDAIRVLGPYGTSIEMLGVPPERSPTPQRPAAQIQEIRSCIRSALLLLASVGGRAAEAY
jgi:hypothetical protein